MNNKKICFIMCVNDEDYEQEQLKYLKHLAVPQGYEIDWLAIHEASSMTSGYNEGMNASDAKYKVYIHQDAFIVNQYFIEDILKIFENKSIGMIGVIGAPQLPQNEIMWAGDRIGKLYYNMVYESGATEIGNIDGLYQEVEAIDGLLMATQYDILWREDLFRKWDFYDISQSQEFLLKGYKVVVPNQKQPWCIHDNDLLNLKNYYHEREIFLKEYRS